MNLSGAMIRGISMMGAFVGLLVSLYFLWQHRFERIENLSVVALEDLISTGLPKRGVEWKNDENGSKIRLIAKEGESPVVARFQFPSWSAVEYLHLKFEGSAVELTPGPEDWEDGRCIIEWHAPAAPDGCENESIFTARFNLAPTPTEMVVKPLQSPAVPALRLENLGKSGIMEFSRFEATAVRQSLIWKIGRWILVFAWLYWGVLWIKGFGGKSSVFRVWAASCIWLIMGIYCVVPGPWAAYRPFSSPFQLGDAAKMERTPSDARISPNIQASNHSVTSASGIQSKSIGKIPQKGDLTLKIKIYAQKARTLLHVALLFGPTLLIACLVGRKPAFSLMMLMTLAIEAAEAAFGFGFDGWDVVDLLCDVAGIGLALIVYYGIQRRHPNIICS